MLGAHVLSEVDVYPVTFSVRELDLSLIESHRPRPVIHVKDRVSLLKFQGHEVLNPDFRVVGHRTEVKHQTVVHVRRYLETWSANGSDQ